MKSQTMYSVDGVLWLVNENNYAEPVCPTCRIKLSPHTEFSTITRVSDTQISQVICMDCGKKYKLSRSLFKDRRYVVEKILAIEREKYKIIDIDGILTPVTNKTEVDLGSGYFCTFK